MHKKYFLLLAVCATVILFSSVAKAAEEIKDDFAQIELTFQHDTVAPDSNSAVQLKFSLEKDWHFYADEDTAPPGMNLRIEPQAKGIIFSEPVFPEGHLYFDKVTNRKLEVYSGSFSIYIPFRTRMNSKDEEVKVSIGGAVCSEQLCRLANYELSKKLGVSKSARMDEPRFSVPASAVAGQTTPKIPRTSAAVALPLAIVAGLLLNVMPCVWPVLPIIVMRLVAQAKQSRVKSLALGLAFAAGIVLFFVVLAVASTIFKVGFGMVFQWGDQFRNPAFIIAMVLLMVVLALYMFGLFTFGLPALITGRRSQKAGFAGSLGMGFLAAVLSTPCSFAILAFVIAWAQTQPIPLAVITILLIGVGMALPYVILISIPELLEKIPKPGRWMELFKHATGFILLAIGVKLLEAVQPGKIIDVLYYAVVLAVCVWMWGVWVQYNTPAVKKWAVRIVAVALAVIFGLVFLSEPKKALINWHSYDADVIASAQKNNQPVLIKFTADWCFSCKILDKTVYSSAEIADLIKRKGVLAVKADTTRFDCPAAGALKEIYSEPAIPVTIVLLPGQNSPIKLRGNLIKNELMRDLQKLPDKNQR